MKKLAGISLFLFLIIPVIIFHGCKGCNDRSYSYSFTAFDLMIVPYSGNETLIFKSQEGDSVIYTCSGRINITDNPVYLYNEDCNRLVVHIPTNTTTFLSGNDTLIVQLYMSVISSTVARKVLNISFSDLNRFSLEGYSWDFGFDADTILVYPSFPSQYDGAVAFHDSLTIIQKTFHDVYELISHRTPAVPESFIRSVYYTIPDGIVGFQTNKSIRWETR